MKYFDNDTKEKFIPYIIETSAGATRSFMAFLIDAYKEETVNGETRNILKFHPKIAPIKVAIFPLINKEGMPEIARNIEKKLRPFMKVFYDSKGAIGRRYRRQDEIGTPYCITVDGETIKNNTVTVRDRDSMEQIRINTEKLLDFLAEKLM